MSGKRQKSDQHVTRSTQDDVATDTEMQGDNSVLESPQRASSRARKLSQKARDNDKLLADDESADVVNLLRDVVMQLKQANKRAEEANKRNEEANKRNEEANRRLASENKELKEMMVSLKLDMESMKAASPYWGQSLEAQSYASVLKAGTNSSGSGSFGRPKSVSFSDSLNSSGSSRSSILKSASEQGMQDSALVVELSDMSEIENAEQARSKLTEVLRAVDGLQDLELMDFKFFTRATSKSIRFVISKEQEIIVRRAGEVWTNVIPGARLIAPKWFPVKVDWIEKSLAADMNSLDISESARQRFATENSVDVKRMKWLKRPKPEAKFGTAIVKLATKADAEKLLLGRPSFGGQSVTVQAYVERRTPKVCYKCQGFGHIARDCIAGTRCPFCAESHEQASCNATTFKCVNCSGPHKAFDRHCKVYLEAIKRMANFRPDE